MHDPLPCACHDQLSPACLAKPGACQPCSSSSISRAHRWNDMHSESTHMRHRWSRQLASTASELVPAVQSKTSARRTGPRTARSWPRCTQTTCTSSPSPTTSCWRLMLWRLARSPPHRQACLNDARAGADCCWSRHQYQTSAGPRKQVLYSSPSCEPGSSQQHPDIANAAPIRSWHEGGPVQAALSAELAMAWGQVYCRRLDISRQLHIGQDRGKPLGNATSITAELR